MERRGNASPNSEIQNHPKLETMLGAFPCTGAELISCSSYPANRANALQPTLNPPAFAFPRPEPRNVATNPDSLEENQYFRSGSSWLNKCCNRPWASNGRGCRLDASQTKAFPHCFQVSFFSTNSQPRDLSGF